MKELLFREQGLSPLTINIRILKLWNSTVCSVHSGPPSHCDTVSLAKGGGGILEFRDLCRDFLEEVG
jgi:hypothetical protein